jgi:hypothetical protein
MVSFFDRSTVMAQPWAKAGYLCYCIDLQHPDCESAQSRGSDSLLMMISDPFGSKSLM